MRPSLTAYASLTLALALASFQPGCGSRGPSPRDADDELAELRRRVATNPRDRAAHRDLGRLRLAARQKGLALTHLDAAGPLRSTADTHALAELYLERAEARLDAGDLGAYPDVERAIALGLEPNPTLVDRALRGAALAAFRRGDSRGIEAGKKRIETLVEKTGATPLAALLDLALAPVADIGVAGLWLEAGGAKRHALRVFRAYRHRGGGDGATLLGLERMERWWGAPPTLATGPRDLGSELVRSLRAWMHGERHRWLLDLGSPSEVASQLEAAPRWARPTLLRTLGRDAEARVALDAARAGFEELDDDAKAVVLAELALSDPSGAALPPAEGALAWLVFSRARRARVPAALEARWTTTAPTSLRALEARVTFDVNELVRLGDPPARYALARLARSAPRTAAVLAAPSSTPPVSWIAPLGTIDPVRLASDLGQPDVAATLAEIAQAIAIDPALADRRAREWIDAAILPHHRGNAVVELYVRAGDPGRAREFAERLLAASPDHPAFLITAAIRAAASGDTARAKVLTSQAAARSGDAGAVYRRMTRELLDAGANLAAIAAGKRALGLSAPSHEGDVRVLIARGMLRMARRTDARELLEHDSVAATRRAELLEPTTPDDSPSSSLAWNPASPGHLATRAMSDAPDADAASARLAALALFSHDPSALLTWASVLETAGRPGAASAARAEAVARGARSD